MKPVVFIPEKIANGGLDLLRAECICLTPWQDEIVKPVDLANKEFRAALYQADAVIVRLFKITAKDIEKAERLIVIGKHGVGVDNIDCQAATKAGIPVVFTPDANANAVAEHTLALMLALSRQIVPANSALREGRFHERSRFQGVELAGKTLGVVGLGRIGSRVAEMAAFGLGMAVYAYDPYISKASYSGPAILEASLEAMVSKADFLTLHVSLTPETEHMIGGSVLGMIKPGCRIVNTSRGAVVDEVALVRALIDGKLAGAALDVFEEEPLPPDHPLCQAPNTLLTPHISSTTRESLERMSVQVALGVLAVLQGKTPEYIANPEIFR